MVFTDHGEDSLDDRRRCYIAAWPLPNDRHLAVTAREPASQVVRMGLGADGIRDIDEHLKRLALEDSEEKMDIDPCF